MPQKTREVVEKTADSPLRKRGSRDSPVEVEDILLPSGVTLKPMQGYSKINPILINGLSPK